MQFVHGLEGSPQGAKARLLAEKQRGLDAKRARAEAAKAAGAPR